MTIQRAKDLVEAIERVERKISDIKETLSLIENKEITRNPRIKFFSAETERPIEISVESDLIIPLLEESLKRAEDTKKNLWLSFKEEA